MPEFDGYFCLLLHAHLPFVRHPEDDDFLEEDWLYEAIRETYLPLLDSMERLHAERTPFRITMSISPTLAEMLSDPLLQKRFDKRLNKLHELAQKEVRRTNKKPNKAFHESALLYHELIERCIHRFRDSYDRNLLNGFRRFQILGNLEIICCAATHGFLPLMATENAMRAQIEIGKCNYVKHFGCSPKGIWLPECGYDARLESMLEDAGLKYFFLDTHGLLAGDPEPKYGSYAPVETPSGLIAFARDVEASRQVWSREIGYPGDFEYREFYRDLGYDAFYDYIEPYLHHDGVRRAVGFKYHRITGDQIDLKKKEPYRPALARQRTDEHTAHFLMNRCRQMQEAAAMMDKPPLVMAPFDAELFGHWWFEGIYFVESLFRHLAQNPGVVPITPSEYLQTHPQHQQVQPVASSWGHKGHYEVWLNPSNDWVYRHLHHAEQRLKSLAVDYANANGLIKRAINQMARELLLAQSSDWAFIMTSNTAVPYARRRTRDHIHRFLELDKQVQSGEINETYLKDLEWRDTIFQEIDYRVYGSRKK